MDGRTPPSLERPLGMGWADMAWHSRSGILTCLHACLPSQILGEIWALADDENTGFLTKDQFYAVCRMIGHAQHGVQDINPALLKKGASLSLSPSTRHPCWPCPCIATVGPAGRPC